MENSWLYHYTTDLRRIKIYGLFSIYAICQDDKEMCQKVLKYYEERVKKNSGKKEVKYRDYEKYFKSVGISDKGMFFLFNRIPEGLNKEFDKFQNEMDEVRIRVDMLRDGWKYFLVYRGKVKRISLDEVRELSKIDYTDYAKKPAKPFIFSNIPHLMIETKDGKIGVKYLEI